MMFVQRSAWALLLVCLAASLAVAGPNAGGVIVVHTSGLAYTTDTGSYVGLSGVACGQDGPEFPQVPVCPPYDPTSACNQGALNPTSTQAAGVAHVWFVLAAFPPKSCPRLKATAFRINYDDTKVTMVTSGYDGTNAFTVEDKDPDDNSPWLTPGSQTAWSFGLPAPLGPSTSRLMELYWFAGYLYAAPTTDAKFEVLPHGNPVNRFFIDDSVPPKSDPIKGYGTLGFLGTAGSNPTPIQELFGCCVSGVCQVLTVDECTAASGGQLSDLCYPNIPDDEECVITPVESTSWGQVKYLYSR